MQVGDPSKLLGGMRFADPDLQRRRPAKQEALHHLTTGSTQERRLVLRLDAFGNDADAERPRKPDDRRDDRARARIGVDAAYERAVDLELAEREIDQVAQIGISGAEIVDGDGYAHRGKLLEDRG